jgi:hypothetical protein
MVWLEHPNSAKRKEVNLLTPLCLAFGLDPSRSLLCNGWIVRRIRVRGKAAEIMRPPKANQQLRTNTAFVTKVQVHDVEEEDDPAS